LRKSDALDGQTEKRIDGPGAPLTQPQPPR